MHRKKPISFSRRCKCDIHVTNRQKIFITCRSRFRDLAHPSHNPLLMKSRLQRYSKYGMTTFELSTQEFELQIRLVSKLSKRERRTLARSLFTQIKPWMKTITRASIGHASHGLIIDQRNQQRIVRALQSRSIDTPTGRFGFDIRMQRLKLGLSQDEFASKLGINRSHLSRIERGLHLPRTKLQSELTEALKGLEMPPI